MTIVKFDFGEITTKKNISSLPILLSILLVGFFVISSYQTEAQPQKVIEGYIYIDGIITKAQEVHVTFPSQFLIATVYDDGRYRLVFHDEEINSTGEFSVIYRGSMYIPNETVVILKDWDWYYVDLHITTSENGQTPEDPTNKQLKADAGGPYYQLVGQPIQFDGTKSISYGGTIKTYDWNFGDNTTATGATPAHLYSEEGNYTVILTITDNMGDIAHASTYALISKTFNQPPQAPQVIGSPQGNISSEYTLIIQTTDPDNDTIQYIIDWGDTTDMTTTDFVPNGTTTTVVHHWTKPGIYTITVNANDIHNAISESVEITVMVNIYYINTIGYLLDNQNDGTYDAFYSNTTRNITSVQQHNNIYFIDTNNDGTVDHQYNIITRELTTFSTPQYILNLTSSTILVVVIAVVGCILVLIGLITTIKKGKPLPHTLTLEEKVNHVYSMEKTGTTKTIEKNYQEIQQKINETIEKIENLKKKK